MGVNHFISVHCRRRSFIMKTKILVVLTMSIVLLGLTGTADATYHWYFTKPYDKGASSYFYGDAYYDLSTGYLRARCMMTSGLAWGAASLGPDDMGMFLDCDWDVEVTVDVTLTAFLDVIPVIFYPATALVMVNVYLINEDSQVPSELDSICAYYKGIVSAFGRVSFPFSNERIVRTVTLNPHNLQQTYWNWRVAVEFYVGCQVVFGQARVSLSGSQVYTPAALRVNSITVNIDI